MCIPLLLVRPQAGLLEGVGGETGLYWAALFNTPVLNGFMALERKSWRCVQGTLHRRMQRWWERGES